MDQYGFNATICFPVVFWSSKTERCLATAMNSFDWLIDWLFDQMLLRDDYLYSCVNQWIPKPAQICSVISTLIKQTANIIAKRFSSSWCVGQGLYSKPNVSPVWGWALRGSYISLHLITYHYIASLVLGNKRKNRCENAFVSVKQSTENSPKYPWCAVNLAFNAVWRMKYRRWAQKMLLDSSE